MSTIADINAVYSDWDKIQRMRVALEKYADILRGRKEASVLETKFFSIGLESIDPDFDIKEGSRITLRAIKEGIKAAAKTAADVIKVIWEMIKSLYIKFTGSIRQVRKNQASISKRLGRIGSKTTYSKMTVSGVQRLSIDGNFVGTDVESLAKIKSLTDYILNVYPKSVIKISRDCSRYFLNLIEEKGNVNQNELAVEAMETFAEVLQRDFKPPPNHRPLQPRELTTAHASMNRSDVMPGNVALVFTPPSAIGQQLQAPKINVTNIVSQAFVMQFTELQLNVADNSEREIDVPSVRTLVELNEMISAVLSIAERADAGVRDYNSVKTVVDDAIRQIAEKAEANGESQNGSLLLHITGEISKKLSEPASYFTHWLAVTLNVWLTFIGHCLTHYENDGI